MYLGAISAMLGNAVASYVIMDLAGQRLCPGVSVIKGSHRSYKRFLHTLVCYELKYHAEE
jgi:hypothetical protein